nr:glutathione peroxidase [Pseudomonas duriflava]
MRGSSSKAEAIQRLLQTPFRLVSGASVCLLDIAPDAKAYLLVNTASRCGFTPQYEGLEELWQFYQEKGLVVVGFPCNQFNHQEPGSNHDIERFCQVRFGVSFPLSCKVDVNGKEAHPLFSLLKELAPGLLGGPSIKWNFTKFLVGTRDASVQRFAPWVKPVSLRKKLERLLIC